MHFPEFILEGGGFGSLGSQLGFLMNADEGQVSENHRDLFGIGIQEGLDLRLKLGAVRALEIAVDDQCHAAIFGAAGVIFRFGKWDGDLVGSAGFRALR